MRTYERLTHGEKPLCPRCREISRFANSVRMQAKKRAGGAWKAALPTLYFFQEYGRPSPQHRSEPGMRITFGSAGCLF